ncbi:hypothetical protein [Billgrantia montanilacus]|uniref:Uncharacterized protein n=1 Tax=Billgrantia montanilacus TaxID=2282305 RepID=A0A368TY38_9GAMM|nr:hypothetical protein [Halomonas montanilacus]RCV89695.1 hypothetical protein DU505_08820 [Halomonas montanilacus]
MRQRMTSHQPRGVLQDAGTLAVLTPNQGAVEHQFAMVVAFESEGDLRRAIANSRCGYRLGQKAQELSRE